MDYKSLVLKHVNFKGFSEDILKLVIEPAINKFVAESANKYDDMLVLALLPTLEEAVIKFVDEQVAKLGA